MEIPNWRKRAWPLAAVMLTSAALPLAGLSVLLLAIVVLAVVWPSRKRLRHLRIGGLLDVEMFTDSSSEPESRAGP
jgi:hypothetical protein